MQQERGRGQDQLGISAGTLLGEAGGHSTLFTVEKWDIDQVRFARRQLDRLGHRLPIWEPGPLDFARLKVAPFETYAKDNANLILDTGWQMLMNGVAGSAVTKFASGTGRIGLGTSATAVTYTDSALNAIGALTSHNWAVLNATPTVSSTHGGGLILAASFPTGDANNVAIQEFGVDSGTSATLSTAAVGVFFSHGSATPGTKTNVQVWNATVTVTWL